jgi:hypothetical protein
MEWHHSWNATYVGGFFYLCTFYFLPYPPAPPPPPAGFSFMTGGRLIGDANSQPLGAELVEQLKVRSAVCDLWRGPRSRLIYLTSMATIYTSTLDRAPSPPQPTAPNAPALTHPLPPPKIPTNPIGRVSREAGLAGPAVCGPGGPLLHGGGVHDGRHHVHLVHGAARGR